MADPEPSLVLLGPLALAVTVAIGAGGSAVTARIFVRACELDLSRKTLWLLLAALLVGLSVWGGHLIAIIDLADRAGRRLDLSVALGALALALVGTTLSLGITQALDTLQGRRLGGAAIGVTSAATFRTLVCCLAPAEGVAVNEPVFALGALASAVLGAGAMQAFPAAFETNGNRRWAGLIAAKWLALSAAAWAALRVAPRAPDWSHADAVSADAGFLLLALIASPLALIAAVARLTDRAARREAMLRDRHNAMHDHLTGLPNRRALNESLSETVAEAERDGGRVGVVAMDLDRFKPINDVHGHETGDRVLATIAQRFVEVLEPGEMIARTGGDEFVAIKRDAVCAERVEDFARRLRKAALRPIRREGLVVTIGASLGACLYPDDQDDPGALLACADLALYRAKQAAGDAIRFYEHGMHEAVRQRSAVALELRDALARGQFELLYQPQVALASGETVAYEALLRWNHPERGRLSPAEFIPIAEQSGLTWDLGEWVLRTACAEAAFWRCGLRIAVNVSPQQINHAGFVELILDTLLMTGVEADRLELEVTEASMVLDEARTREAMGELKKAGVRIVMDDYGAGFASLSMLKRFPFDKIKIDKEFVQDVTSSPQASAIVRSALLVGEAGGIPVLAEGVETPAQRRWLLREGCREGQGFLLGRPGPAPSLAAPGAAPPPLRRDGGA
ncbi:MAG: putative bifunctional diguanylate cyclase/phosphodiesterase [Pseudomonadota bacterium]